MDHQKALNEISKYIAQSKEIIQKYLNDNVNVVPPDSVIYLEEAIKLLNIALDNVVI